MQFCKCGQYHLIISCADEKSLLYGKNIGCAQICVLEVKYESKKGKLNLKWKTVVKQ